MKKTLLFCGMTILGAVLLAVGLLGNFGLPDNISRIMMNVGGLLAVHGASLLWTRFWTAVDPIYRKQCHIDQTDERNVAIRDRAKAQAGDLLQWLMMAGMVLAIGLNAPTWVVLLPLAAFEVKRLVESYLIGRYQEEM